MSTTRPVALITGAGSGIGQAIAIRFAQHGCDCVLVGRTSSRLLETAQAITALPEANKDLLKRPGEAIVCQLDASTWDAEAKLGEWLKANGALAQRLTYLVLNAGIYHPQTTLGSNATNWSSQFATNLFGPVAVTKACAPSLIQNEGAILGVSSTLGARPTAGTAAYSASKAALNNWLQSLALEMAPHNVRVNVIAPGIVDTPIHSFHKSPDKSETLKNLSGLQPLGRVGQPEDIAHMAWAMCGPGSEWMTGAIVNVDGGISIA